MLVTLRDQRVCPQLYNSHLSILYTFNFFFKEKGVTRIKKTIAPLVSFISVYVFFFLYFFSFFLILPCFFILSFCFVLLFFSFLQSNRCFFENGEEFRHDAVLDGHTLVKMLEESPFSLIKKVERVCDNKCVTHCVTGVIQRTCGKLRKQKDLLKKLLIAILLCCRLKLQF